MKKGQKLSVQIIIHTHTIPSMHDLRLGSPKRAVRGLFKKTTFREFVQLRKF